MNICLDGRHKCQPLHCIGLISMYQDSRISRYIFHKTTTKTIAIDQLFTMKDQRNSLICLKEFDSCNNISKKIKKLLTNNASFINNLFQVILKFTHTFRERKRIIAQFSHIHHCTKEGYLQSITSILHDPNHYKIRMGIDGCGHSLQFYIF